MSNAKLENARRASIALISERYSHPVTTGMLSPRQTDQVLDHLMGLLPELSRMARDAECETLANLLTIAAREAMLLRDN